MIWGPGGFSPEQNNPGNTGVSLSTVCSTPPPPSIRRREGSGRLGLALDQVQVLLSHREVFS